MYRLVIAEKPSVAMSIAKVLGATARKEGHMEGGGWLVSWCIGHLAGLAEPTVYNPDYDKWRREDLPILPESWRFTIGKDKREQFDILRTLLRREDVSEVVNACDAGREGELIFRTAYHLAGCTKPMKRLWISSMEDSAIREGFDSLRPGSDYDGLHQAALCRQKADWLVGINATRLFSVLYGRTLNIKKYGTEQRWIESKDPEFDEFFGYDKVSFVIVLPDGVRIWGRQDVGDGYGGLLDYLRQNEKYRDIVPILQQAAEREQAAALPPDLSDRPVTREGNTITIGSGDASHEVDITVSDEDWQNIQEVIGAADQPPHDPFAPPYRPGDMVYLNNTAFEITGIGLLDVELRDPALPIPLFRTESKENFERLLHQDTRNGRITSYLPADMSRVNDDFREVLTSHLMTDRDKGYISGWLRSGENNRGIAQRLSLAFASRAETVTLETGDIADYFTSTVSMAVEIQDKFGTKLSLSWEAVAPILRALWLQELDGFSHEPVQRDSVELAGQLTYREGDKVAFGYGDHDIAGTIEYIRLWMRC